jgi:hypothetical protein
MPKPRICGAEAVEGCPFGVRPIEGMRHAAIET